MRSYIPGTDVAGSRWRNPAANDTAAPLSRGEFLSLAAALLVTGCSGSDSKSAATALPADASRLDIVIARDKLIVGTYSTSPPLAFINPDGELAGFEIDLARAIAKDLLGDSEKVEFVVLNAAGRFPAVLTGKIDFGLCSTSITGDRAARVAFTPPYLDTGGTVIARRDAGLTHVRQLNDPRFTYALLNNPGSIERAEQELPRAKTIVLDNPAAILLATKVGRATAFNIDRAIAHQYVADNPDLMLLDTSGTVYNHVSGNAIFLKPGDFKWWLFLSTWMNELRGGSRYAQYRTLYLRWFDKEPPPQRFYDVSRY